MTASVGGGRLGLWLVGARGSVATTTVCGLLGLQAGLTPPTGCVSTRLESVVASMPRWDSIVVGGHDLVSRPLRERAAALSAAGVVPARLLEEVGPALDAVDGEIRPGYEEDGDHPCGDRSVRAAVGRLTADICRFQDRHALARVVVVNVATTQPPMTPRPEHDDLDLLDAAMVEPEASLLPVSAVSAYAALAADCPYVDFTPSPSMRVPALAELARRRGLPYAGSDGKTGQTLVRGALAPMFLARALAVRSWSGTNLLGGGDGAALAEAQRATAKLQSKSRGITAVLGADVVTPLHIDYVPDLGERKVAWDHVSAEGFLGSPISLQVTWSGYDSALAAPLVLDLTRLVAAAHEAGESGPLSDLAVFFKDPLGEVSHCFADQVRSFEAWASRLGARA